MSRLIPVAHWPVAIAALCIALGSVVPGRTAASDHSKGMECAAIDDAAARLACFDAAFPRVTHASAPKPPAPAAVAVKPASDDGKFGLSNKQRAALETKRAEPAVAATTAGVKTVRKLPSGYLLIGLDNDQVWQQTEIDPLVQLQPGDRVQIRQASMGSFLLLTPAQYSTRVRRIQ